MSSTHLKSALTVTALLVLATTVANATPAGRNRSSHKSVSVYVFNVAQVPGGPMLKPGDYRVVLMNADNPPQVAFYRNEKLVGKATAQLVSVEKAPDHTSVRYVFRDQKDPVVSEIDVKGWTQKIVFGQPS